MKNKLILELKEYFENTENIDKENIFIIIKKYNLEDFIEFVNFNKDKYFRNIIFQSELFEIILICWDVNQKSKVHDHPKNGGFMKLLKGELTEKLYSNNKNDVVVTKVRKNDLTFIDDNIGFHEIINNGEEQAISLHIYSPGKYIPKEIEILKE